MATNNCSNCNVILWENITCNGCENEKRRQKESNAVIVEYINGHNNNICICGKKAIMIAKTANTIGVCGKCEFKGIVTVMNGTVVVK